MQLSVTFLALSHAVQMSWELGSNYFGYLLRRVAPNDTYDVYKWGNRIRVDGTLMGIDDKSKSLIPEWKRGHFSVLFLPPGAPGTAGEDKSKIVLVNRVTNEWIDLSESKKEQQRMTGASSESREVSMLMRDGAGKTKMKTSELKFKPVKTWTGGVYKEKVCVWNTTVYEAQARLVAITTYKTPMELPEEVMSDDDGEDEAVPPTDHNQFGSFWGFLFHPFSPPSPPLSPLEIHFSSFLSSFSSSPVFQRPCCHGFGCRSAFLVFIPPKTLKPLSCLSSTTLWRLPVLV